MKVRVQRIGRSEDYTPHAIDERLLEGTIRGGLRPGEYLRVQFARLDQGVWQTTKITRVEYADEQTTLIHTKNSIYVVVKGWKEN